MQVDEVKGEVKSPVGKAVLGPAGKILTFFLAAALPVALLWLLWARLPDATLARLEPGLRWGVAAAGIAASFLTARSLWPRKGFLELLSFSLLGVAALFMLGSYLQLVNSYPFKLSWSEGNRFYDYSLIFGKYLYQAETPPELFYNDPGRYGLWGILFAIPGLPVWVHRLWNALLFTVPLLLVGMILAGWIYRNKRLRPETGLGLPFALWTFLFLIQGPIYPSLVLSALLVLVSARWKRLAFKAVVVFVAGYYAALSRWTWLPAAGVWAGLIAFLWDEHGAEASPPDAGQGSDPKGRVPQGGVPQGGVPQGGGPSNRFARWLALLGPRQALVEAVVLGAAGLVGGVLAKPGLLLSPQQETGFAFQQPLLWYRLFPNATYGPGILLALALAAGPLALLLAGLVLLRAWRLSWLQAAAAALPALVFLAMGTVASTKIGGGSNLHNLDMFLISLVIYAGLALRVLSRRGLSLGSAFAQPALRLAARGLLALAVLAPAWNGLQAGGPLRLPAQETVEQALNTIRAEVERAEAQGEVLFMDQRQLLTFGYIGGVNLVHEYEMKYMMDQSMSGDPTPFEQFYEDLRNKRFELIVIHPLKIQYQGRTRGFGEENDAWVKWVAEAMLCSYRPIVTMKEVSVELLEPRPGRTEKCP